jgi:hypothetical protein
MPPGGERDRLRKSISKCNNYMQLSLQLAIGAGCFDGINTSDFQFYKKQGF